MEEIELCLPFPSYLNNDQHDSMCSTYLKHHGMQHQKYHHLPSVFD